MLIDVGIRPREMLLMPDRTMPLMMLPMPSSSSANAIQRMTFRQSFSCALLLRVCLCQGRLSQRIVLFQVDSGLQWHPVVVMHVFSLCLRSRWRMHCFFGSPLISALPSFTSTIFVSVLVGAALALPLCSKADSVTFPRATIGGQCQLQRTSESFGLLTSQRDACPRELFCSSRCVYSTGRSMEAFECMEGALQHRGPSTGDRIPRRRVGQLRFDMGPMGRERGGEAHGQGLSTGTSYTRAHWGPSRQKPGNIGLAPLGRGARARKGNAKCRACQQPRSRHDDGGKPHAGCRPQISSHG